MLLQGPVRLIRPDNGITYNRDAWSAAPNVLSVSARHRRHVVKSRRRRSFPARQRRKSNSQVASSLIPLRGVCAAVGGPRSKVRQGYGRRSCVANGGVPESHALPPNQPRTGSFGWVDDRRNNPGCRGRFPHREENPTRARNKTDSQVRKLMKDMGEHGGVGGVGEPATG